MKIKPAHLAEINKLPDWRYHKDRISKLFEFTSFEDAIKFINAAALKSAEMDHHPEWKNIYNKVWVELTTHDAKCVTHLDIELAQYMDAAYFNDKDT